MITNRLKQLLYVMVLTVIMRSASAWCLPADISVQDPIMLCDGMDGMDDMLALDANPSRSLYADYDAICDRQPMIIAPWYERWFTMIGSAIFVRYIAIKKMVARWAKGARA